MGALSVFFLMGILSTLFLIFVSLFIGILCTYVVGYLFEGFLVSSLLDTKTYRGWIPFYNKYLLGNITGDHVLGIISSICALPVLIIGYVLFVMDEIKLSFICCVSSHINYWFYCRSYYCLSLLI